MSWPPPLCGRARGHTNRGPAVEPAVNGCLMAAPATTDDVLDLVRKSGVLDETRLAAYLDRSRAVTELPTSPPELAKCLVRDGLLTGFQAEQLLIGKWRRFSIGKYKVLERLGQGGMGSV